MPPEEREPVHVSRSALDPVALEHRLTTIEVSTTAGFDRVTDAITRSRADTKAEIEMARDEITRRQDIANGRTDKLEAMSASLREDMRTVAPTVLSLRQDVDENIVKIGILLDAAKVRNAQGLQEGTLFVITRKNLAAFAAAMVAMIPIVAAIFEAVKERL